MSEQISNQSSFLAFIRDQAMSNGNLSIRGVERCCGITNASLFDGVDIRVKHLRQTLTAQGFQAVDLQSEGFPPQAVWLCIEYYAFDSKAKAPMAKQLARTFGQIGIMETLARISETPIEEARENLETQFGEKIKIKEIREMTDFFGDLFGTPYKQRFGLQQVKKHYPQLAGEPPFPQEWASLPSAKALINVTEIANQLGIFFKTGNPNPQPINAKLVELGYQTVFLDYKNRKKYSPTEKAIVLKLCDRKPVETNSRTQQDQLLWSIDVVDIIKEFFV